MAKLDCRKHDLANRKRKHELMAEESGRRELQRLFDDDMGIFHHLGWKCNIVGS